ncbi:MAG: YggT family protein [Tenericutes bacterium]|nr:YggT family protein [Mycoplasmatota bacterium]
MLEFLSTTDVLGAFLFGVYQVLRIYVYILFIFILLSWTPLVNSKFYGYLRMICDPYLNLFKGKLIFSNMDFGTLFGIIILQVLVYFIGNSLI